MVIIVIVVGAVAVAAIASSLVWVISVWRHKREMINAGVIARFGQTFPHWEELANVAERCGLTTMLVNDTKGAMSYFFEVAHGAHSSHLSVTMAEQEDALMRILVFYKANQKAHFTLDFDTVDALQQSSVRLDLFMQGKKVAGVLTLAEGSRMSILVDEKSLTIILLLIDGARRLEKAAVSA